MPIEWMRSATDFTYKNTTIRKGDYVEWYYVENAQHPSFYRLRNHSTGAEMKLTPEELHLVHRAILEGISTIPPV